MCQTVSRRLILNWEPSRKETKCLMLLQSFSEGPKTMISDDSLKTTSGKLYCLKWPTVKTKRFTISILLLWKNLNPKIFKAIIIRSVFTPQFWPTRSKFTSFKPTRPIWRNNCKTWNINKKKSKKLFKSRRRNCLSKLKESKEWAWLISMSW